MSAERRVVSADEAVDGVAVDAKTMRGCEGHYRVGMDEAGRWWLVDPAGRPWIFKGVCGLNRAGTQGGRLAKPGPYHDAIGRLFGEDPQRFVSSCLSILASLGFNAAGAWVTEEFFDRGLAYTEILECNKLGESFRMRGPGVNVPDVFDAGWAEAVDAQAARLCGPRRMSRDLVGYFTDNELGWGQPGTDHVWGGSEQLNAGEGRPTLLQFCLTQVGDRAAAVEAERFVLSRHDGRWSDAAKSWGVEAGDVGGLRSMTERGLVLDSPGYGEDHVAFSKHFAATYCRITAEAIRRHDGNHLILGCRFGAPPGEAIGAGMVGEHVDVVSANNYRHTMYERMEEYAAQFPGQPLLIGEFAWASDYFRKIPIGGVHGDDLASDGLTEQERVRAKGREALERVFTHPAVVGYTWYRWINKHDDPEAITYGIVNHEHVVNQFTGRLLAEIHPRLEAIKAGLAAPAGLG